MKIKKLFLRITVMIFSVSLCVSAFVIPSSAFKLTNIMDIAGASVPIHADRHMDNIYGDDFDFVYITQLQSNAPTSNGVTVEDARETTRGKIPAWENYARFENFDNYLTSAYRKIASIEFVVVYTGDPKGSTRRFDVVTEGNMFFPQDLAVYYEDGLRVLYNATTGLYSFSFLYNYWYFTLPPEEGYSLGAIVYHNASDASHADSDKYVTRAEYNAKCTELAEVKRKLTEAQNEYDLKCQEYELKLSEMQEELDKREDLLLKDWEQLEKLKKEISDLEATKEGLETDCKALNEKVNELKGDIQNNNAVKSLFSGVYEAVHNFCNIIFGLSFGGVTVGSVLSVAFVLLIVFFLVKVLRG